MRWFIFEDALRDFQGHWFEHICTLRHGFLELGDQVEVFCAADALKSVSDPLQAKSLLPHSIWHRMGDGAGPLQRLLRIPGHGLQTYRSLQGIFRKTLESQNFTTEEIGREIFFVPTVLPHHLLGWLPHLRRLMRQPHRTVLFYFLTAPLQQGANRGWAFEKAPSAWLLKSLLARLGGYVRQQKVVLAAETRNLSRALSEACGLPVKYLPQPVKDLTTDLEFSCQDQHPPLFASFGAARWEKGSDIEQQAIREYIAEGNNPTARFAMQWLGDFRDPAGQVVVKDDQLERSGKITFITSFFRGDEYSSWLGATSAMLLPYRRCAYGLRGSRVLLEAMVAGIPCITVENSSPAEDLANHGSGLLVKDGDVSSLKAAIHTIAKDIGGFKREALKKRQAATEYYSVRNFKKILLDELGA